VTTENPENPESEKRLPIVIDRKTMPASWEKIVPYFNHSELWHVNRLAKSVGCPYPFPTAEMLPQDSGERFFSEYMTTLKNIGSNKTSDTGECLCQLCNDPSRASGNNNRPTEIVQHHPIGNHNINHAQAVPAPPPPKTPETRHNVPNAVTHRNGAPAAALPRQFNWATMIAPSPCPQVSLLPMWCFPPMLAAAAPPPCCWKYKEWLTRRKGRPPHHPLCNNR